MPQQLTSRRTSNAPTLRTSLAIVAVLLLVPVGYFLVWKPAVQIAQATVVSAPAQGGSESLAQVEERVKEQPTEANRVDLSQAYIQSRQYGAAVNVLTRLTAEYPRNAVAWNNLCVARTLQLEFNLAIEACQSGIRVDSSLQLLQNNLKWANGERDKTVAALAEQQKVDPAKRDAAFYMTEGLLQLHLGAYDQAILAWRRALQLDPKNALAWNNVGTAQMMQNHYVEARASFLHAAALAPENQLVHNNLAWVNGELQTGH